MPEAYITIAIAPLSASIQHHATDRKRNFGVILPMVGGTRRSRPRTEHERGYLGMQVPVTNEILFGPRDPFVDCLTLEAACYPPARPLTQAQLCRVGMSV